MKHEKIFKRDDGLRVKVSTWIEQGDYLTLASISNSGWYYSPISVSHPKWPTPEEIHETKLEL